MVLPPDNHWTLRNSKIFLSKMVHTAHHKPSPIIFPEEKWLLSLSLSLSRTLQTRALVVEPSRFVLTAGQATDEAYAIYFQTKSDWTTDPYKNWLRVETSGDFRNTSVLLHKHIRAHQRFISFFIYLFIVVPWQIWH